MSDHVDVSIACNDRHGRNTGRADAVEFERGGASLNLLGCCHDTSVEFDLKREIVRLDGVEYSFLGFRPYEGNIVWNTVTLAESDARQLFERLRGSGFEVESCDEGAPFADLLTEEAEGA